MYTRFAKPKLLKKKSSNISLTSHLPLSPECTNLWRTRSKCRGVRERDRLRVRGKRTKGESMEQKIIAPLQTVAPSHLHVLGHAFLYISVMFVQCSCTDLCMKRTYTIPLAFSPSLTICEFKLLRAREANFSTRIYFSFPGNTVQFKISKTITCMSKGVGRQRTISFPLF